jgi:hypothetical protein
MMDKIIPQIGMVAGKISKTSECRISWLKRLGCSGPRLQIPMEKRSNCEAMINRTTPIKGDAMDNMANLDFLIFSWLRGCDITQWVHGVK